MNELLRKINETFDASINTSTEETALQLRILKGNINTLFEEAMNNGNNSVVDTINTNNSIPNNMNNTFTAPSVVNPTIMNNESVQQLKNILIVDDSSIIRNYLQKACASKYNMTLASGGEEAINILSSNSYDLILLDLMMPGVDGFGVLEHLKNNNMNIPIIIISGDTTKESIDRAFSYNVVDMIEKPFSEKTILGKIDRILG